MKPRFDCENEVTILAMAKERAGFSLPYSFGLVEANCFRRHVNLKCVMRRFSVRDFVGMHYALRFGDPNSQRLYIGYSLVKCAVRLCIPDCLIEQVNEVVK